MYGRRLLCEHRGCDEEYFFFSSRRRHTRYWRDWSSDVCSSDLNAPVFAVEVWPYLTSLPICLYTPSDACPRMTEGVVRRLTPRIPPGPPQATDPEAADVSAAPPAGPFHVPLATCS